MNDLEDISDGNHVHTNIDAKHYGFKCVTVVDKWEVSGKERNSQRKYDQTFTQGL